MYAVFQARVCWAVMCDSARTQITWWDWRASTTNCSLSESNRTRSSRCRPMNRSFDLKKTESKWRHWWRQPWNIRSIWRHRWTIGRCSSAISRASVCGGSGYTRSRFADVRSMEVLWHCRPRRQTSSWSWWRETRARQVDGISGCTAQTMLSNDWELFYCPRKWRIHCTRSSLPAGPSSSLTELGVRVNPPKGSAIRSTWSLSCLRKARSFDDWLPPRLVSDAGRDIWQSIHVTIYSSRITTTIASSSWTLERACHERCWRLKSTESDLQTDCATSKTNNALL